MVEAGYHGPYGPSKLTPTMQARIVEFARQGMSPNRISALLRTGKNQVKLWLTKGEEDDEAGIDTVYRELFIAHAEAEAEFVRDVTVLWRAQVKDDWRAGQSLLARRFPKEWGPSVSEMSVSAEAGESAIKVNIKQEEFDAI